MDKELNNSSESLFSSHLPGTILTGPDNKEYRILEGPHIIANGDCTYYGFDVVEIE